MKGYTYADLSTRWGIPRSQLRVWVVRGTLPPAGGFRLGPRGYQPLWTGKQIREIEPVLIAAGRIGVMEETQEKELSE